MDNNKYTVKDLNRFWANVNKNGTIHPYDSKLGMCWEWTRSCGSHGYGQFSRNKENILAHRASWEIEFGDITPNMEVCHSCDNPVCCNPNHLFLGTHKENMRDMIDKGRGDHLRNNNTKGERHGMHKLSLEQVECIRQLYAKGDISQSQLARNYHVRQGTIWYIVKNKTWR